MKYPFLWISCWIKRKRRIRSASKLRKPYPYIRRMKNKFEYVEYATPKILYACPFFISNYTSPAHHSNVLKTSYLCISTLCSLHPTPNLRAYKGYLSLNWNGTLLGQHVLISTESRKSTNENDSIKTDTHTGFALGGGWIGSCCWGFWGWVAWLGECQFL